MKNSLLISCGLLSDIENFSVLWLLLLQSAYIFLYEIVNLIYEDLSGLESWWYVRRGTNLSGLILSEMTSGSLRIINSGSEHYKVGWIL